MDRLDHPSASRGPDNGRDHQSFKSYIERARSADRTVHGLYVRVQLIALHGDCMGNSIPCRTAQEPGGPLLFLRGSTVWAATFTRTSVLHRCDGAPTMHAISDNAVSQQSLAAPSVATYRAGESALSANRAQAELDASGGNLVYAGYPYDPFVLNT